MTRAVNSRRGDGSTVPTWPTGAIVESSHVAPTDMASAERDRGQHRCGDDPGPFARRHPQPPPLALVGSALAQLAGDREAGQDHGERRGRGGEHGQRGDGRPDRPLDACPLLRVRRRDEEVLRAFLAVLVRPPVIRGARRRIERRERGRDPVDVIGQVEREVLVAAGTIGWKHQLGGLSRRDPSRLVADAVVAVGDVGAHDHPAAGVEPVRQHLVGQGPDADHPEMFDADRLDDLVVLAQPGEVARPPERHGHDVADLEVLGVGDLGAHQGLPWPCRQPPGAQRGPVHLDEPSVDGSVDEHHRAGAGLDLAARTGRPVVDRGVEVRTAGHPHDAGQRGDDLLDLRGVNRRVEHEVADIGPLEVLAVGGGGAVGSSECHQRSGRADDHEQRERDHRHRPSPEPAAGDPSGRRHGTESTAPPRGG